MTTTKANLIPLTITPGVQPPTDKTPLATPHYTAASKIRFRFGFPEKLGGWMSVLFIPSDAPIFDSAFAIFGLARSLFSTVLSTTVDTLIGTSSYLYALLGSSITNITPLQASTIAMANNSFFTDYSTLGNNLIFTTIGSPVVTFDSSVSQYYAVGDLITISGATAVGGFTTGQLNAQHKVESTSNFDGFTVILSSNATSTAAGGGASVVAASGLVHVVAAANGMVDGERVKITGATTFGGITIGQINSEFVVRQAQTNAFYVMTTGTATSSATGGGSGAAYAPQIAGGAVNEGIGSGYGCGNYGVSLYGIALPSSSVGVYPQIWFMDRFGVDVIMTPGNQGGLYSWAGATITAPALVLNAPTAINYAFVSNNIVVTFGAGGVANNITTSDQGNMTIWESSSTNQVFIYNVNGATALLSHVPVAGVNLIFTAHATYLFQYIGLPLIWNIQLLEQNVGIIGPMARISVGGIAYWMDTNGFWMWAGGNVLPIPSNSQENSTLLHYVFQNINQGQAYKSFAWYNEQFQEIWFHYPSASSNECDSIARYHVVDQTWVPDTMDRTCAEYPNLAFGYPRLISSAGTLFHHEVGSDDDGSPMTWSLTSNLRGGSNIMQRAYGIPPKEISLLTGFIPDSQQTGNINVEIVAKRFPQSATDTYDQNYTVTPTTEFVSTEIGGRFWQYTLSGSALGQSWRAGQWMEYVQPGSLQ